MPAVLLVEDDETNRKLKASVLKELAGRGPVVAVESSDEAIRAVRALPGFDLIVTDINLPRPGDRSDTNRDGIHFARWLRRSDYPTLLTGYSSVFSEGEIDKGDRDLFYSFLGRGEGADEIIERFASWLAESADFRKRRSTSSPSFAEGLVSVDVIDLKEERAIRELLDDDFKVKLGRLTGAHKHARQFFVWFREDPDDGAFVEVFGQPYLYASGATLDDAEAQLGVLMAEYMEDIGHASDETLGRSMIALRNFLREVFGEQI